MKRIKQKEKAFTPLEIFAKSKTDASGPVRSKTPRQSVLPTRWTSNGAGALFLTGFTIVELLVVILIISMLAAFVAPRMFRGLGKAKRDIARAMMANIENAIGRFYIDCGRYPYESEGLEELVAPASDVEEKWNGPYLKRSELLDPWDNPYIYIEEGEINPGSFDLISFGADGMEGGEGDDEDIYND